jgi:hypothetical protein
LGTSKVGSQVHHSGEPDQLLQAIDAIFQSIEKATLECVFQEWLDRLAQYCVLRHIRRTADI